MIIERVESYVAIIGGIIGIIGGALGFWIFYKTELIEPPTFQIIGMRYIDSSGNDLDNPASRASADIANKTVEVRFELAFRYYNNTDRFLHPTQIDPILIYINQGNLSEEDVNKIRELTGDSDFSCYLENIKSAVPPKSAKNLSCRTILHKITFDGYGFPVKQENSIFSNPLYDIWQHACAAAINLTETNDANLPDKFHFVHNYNVVGENCL